MKRTIASKNLPILEIDSERLDFRQTDGEQEALHQFQCFLQGLQPPDT
jgi:hypothetical protein